MALVRPVGLFLVVWGRGGFVADDHVILYDGVCGLCDRFTRLVIRYDGQRRFRFAPLQGSLAARVLSPHGKDPRDLDTLYVVLGRGTPSESLLSRSDAVLFVLRELGGFWRLLGAAAGWLPGFLLDGAYRLVARHRYRVFGRYQACPIPEPFERDRFLESELVSERDERPGSERRVSL